MFISPSSSTGVRGSRSTAGATIASGKSSQPTSSEAGGGGSCRTRSGTRATGIVRTSQREGHPGFGRHRLRRGRRAADDKGAADVRESLALARFFLDRGEYDSAIEELESALKRAPGDKEVRAALESAKTARAAEASVLGGVAVA